MYFKNLHRCLFYLVALLGVFLWRLCIIFHLPLLLTDALKIPLRISVGEIPPSNHCSDDFECEHTICALNIRKQTSWDDFSKAVTQALANHFQAISSDGWWSLDDGALNNTTDTCLGLGTSSIQSITLGISSLEVKRKLGVWVYLCLRAS